MGASISTWMQIGLVGTTAFLFIKYVTRSKRKKLPNGPPRLPYFGNALSFSGNMYIHKTLTDWSKEYGDFYSVRLGHYDAVVLSSAESMRDLLGKHGEVTSGRLNFMLITKLFKNDKGILNSEGSTWKSLRRTALSSLRDFGLGKKSLEQHIQEEAKCIMAELDKAGNNPINMRSLFMNASTNTISSLILGCRYNYDDPAFTEFMNSFDELFKHGGLQNIMMFFPEALFLTPIIAPAFLRAIKSLRVIERFVDKHIKEHRASFDSDNIRDFIDIYIQKEQESTDGSIHTEQNLFGTVFDLFGAGTDTTATSLIWAILYLITDENVQKRCREEINKVIGNSRIPEYNDLKQMPYVNATLQEVQRTASIAPVTILHSTSEELEYKGFVLPKNTLIIPNIYAAHRDPNYWDNPDEFNPERWLDGHGNLKTSSSYLPFGTGPRECMGKSLANQEVFIIFTSLLQQFQFSPADPSNLPSVEGQLGITMYPQEFLVKVQRI